MTTIIITEKTSQKKDLVAAIGNEYGQIFPAEGHLLSLQEPQSVNELWGKWSFDLLKPDDFYPTCPAPDASPSARGKLKAIEAALKKASRVILATDCDREGQLIGEELLRHYNFKGPVGRAIFTAQDEKTLRDAFANLEPNENYVNLGQAALVRQQADQVYNLSLTRAATVALKQPGEYGAIGIGRVKTPTMAIVCIRELEVLDFTPQDYFHIVATASTAAGALQLRYAPKEKILDLETAARLQGAAEGFEGPLSAVKKTKKTKPPKLLDLPELQKICGRKWGWSATKTLDVAQELYDGAGKKIQTYPRAESRYLAENQIDDIGEIVQGLKTLDQYQSLTLDTPQIRKGKSGHFSDAGLKGVSHHAIVPNKNTMDQVHKIYPRLSEDEKKMFDLVASSYLAILMPDYVYESTTVAMDVPGPDDDILTFKVTGNIPKELGWKTIFTDEMEKKEEHAGELPPVQDGDQARLSPVITDTKKTKAPSRFNEGSLIDAMQNAWRFVEDKAVQERLKEAKGIGTPATRAAIISGLKRQNFLTQSGKHIVPTPAGLTLYKTLKSVAPELVDPGVTALWEMKLDDVLEGKQTAREVWDEIGDATSRLISVIRDNGSKAPKISTGMAAPKGAQKFGNGKPTDKMVTTAKSVALKKKVTLPKKIETDFQICKDFLDEHLGGNPLITIEKKLGSGIIKGLGPTAAKILVTAFGVETFKIIDETPERLSDVKGIGPKIVEAAKTKKSVRDVGKLLHSHGVSATYGFRIYKLYGDAAAQIISEDPYRIIRDIKWFGFENADRLANSIGLKQDAPCRAQAALFHTLDQTTGPRSKDILIKQLQARLGISEETLEAALQAELAEKKLQIVTTADIPHIALKKSPTLAKSISKKLMAASNGEIPWPQMDPAKAIGWAETQLKETLSDEHRMAVTTALTTKSLFVTTTPGSDAHMPLQAIMLILKAKGVSIKIAAPSHADATSLNKQFDTNAEPLAKMLGWHSKSGAFKHTAKKPLDCQLLIIHAVHKMDQNLLAAALQALPEEAGLLILGDEIPLGIVGSFDQLAHMRKSGNLSAISLTDLGPARQDSQRLKTLHAILENAGPETSSQSGDTDVFHLTAKSTPEVIAKTIEIVTKRLPTKFGFEAIDDIQVICTGTGGQLGSLSLNGPLQYALNPQTDGHSVDRFGWRYRTGDKIIMVENDFEKAITRGEIGRIKKIEKDSQMLRVNFSGRTIDFQFDELDIMALAYAIPVQLAHKTQHRSTVFLNSGTNLGPNVFTALNSAKDLAVLMSNPT